MGRKSSKAKEFKKQKQLEERAAMDAVDAANRLGDALEGHGCSWKPSFSANYFKNRKPNTVCSHS
uniref:Small EDRK-rich factor-like N-terminal domain-containing protein n=1 Tax=Piliocolobus tephrosceles TaxID=591936 RepID=A0A8C9M0G7_9PRIM